MSIVLIAALSIAVAVVLATLIVRYVGKVLDSDIH